MSAIATVLALMPASIASAATPVWTPPASEIPSRPTYFMYSSKAAAPFPAGSIRTASDATADFTFGTATGEQGNPALSLLVWGTERWDITIGMPANRTRFEVGTYENITYADSAARFARVHQQFAENPRCFGSGGRMEVQQADYVGTVLHKIRLAFKIPCDESPMYGLVSWDRDAVVPPSYNPTTAPAGLWTPPAGAVPATGSSLYVQRGAARTPQLVTGRPGTLTHSVGGTLTESGEQFAPTWGTATPRLGVVLAAPIRAPDLHTGFYDHIAMLEGNPVPGQLEMDASWSCGTTDGWMMIDELTRSGPWITRIVARFESTCAGTPNARGVLTWAASPALAGASPVGGARRGGDPITITGYDFMTVSAVKIGGVSVPFAQAKPGGPVIATAPALPLGNDYPIQVTGTAGTTPADPDFVYDALPNPPLYPTFVDAESGFNALDISWTPPTDLGDSPLTQIYVTVWLASVQGSPVGTADVPLGTSSTTIGHLPANTDLIVRVQYRNAQGFGPPGQLAVIQAWPPDASPFASLSALIDQQYVDFNGRKPTAAERTKALTPMIEAKSTVEDFIAARRLGEWAQYRSPMIRLYSAFFLRMPDTGGLTYWVNKLKSGTNLNTVAAGFAGSSEFKRRYGSLSNNAFVELVYRNVLGRAPDSGGKTYWVNRLNGGLSRGVVMAQFSESSEHVRKMTPTVDAVLLYTGMLRRMPTSTELSAAKPRTPVQLAHDILQTPAYAARF